jgi:hypothetical protein
MRFIFVFYSFEVVVQSAKLIVYFFLSHFVVMAWVTTPPKGISTVRQVEGRSATNLNTGEPTTTSDRSPLIQNVKRFGRLRTSGKF